MKIRSVLSAAVVSLPLFAAACSSGGGSQPTMCYGANIVASEMNDYSFSSSFMLPPVAVKSMANLTFDWSAVTQDFLKHPLNPATDVNTIDAMIFQIPLTKVATKLNDDTLDQGDLFTSVPVSWPAPGASTGGATTAQLYDFQLNGNAITQDMFNQYFDPMMMPDSMYSYMAALQTGTELGRGFRMLQSFKLDASSTNTTVKLTNDSTKLTYSANLHSLTIAGVPAGTPALTLDFTDMVNRMAPNALGGTFKPAYITSAVVGHYTQTPAQLEAQFLDLDRIPTAYYTGLIPSGTVLDFTMLTEQTTGAAFPGIDDTGTWLVGLICGNCRNPAPWYMTILKPCMM